jgi:hypothetical protein
MSRFARILDALYEWRMRQAAHMVREHSHFRAEAEDYERRRDKMIADEMAEARSKEIAQPGMRLASRSAS